MNLLLFAHAGHNHADNGLSPLVIIALVTASLALLVVLVYVFLRNKKNKPGTPSDSE